MKCASQLLVNRNMFHRDNPDCFIDVNVLINKVPLKQANRWLLKLAAVDWGRGGPILHVQENIWSTMIKQTKSVVNKCNLTPQHIH